MTPVSEFGGHGLIEDPDRCPTPEFHGPDRYCPNCRWQPGQGERVSPAENRVRQHLFMEAKRDHVVADADINDYIDTMSRATYYRLMLAHESLVDLWQSVKRSCLSLLP